MVEGPPAGFNTLSDLESAAASKVAADVWDFVQGGAGEERALRANRDAFLRRTLRPRVLAGVRSVDLTTSLLGTQLRLPFYLSPTAYQGAVHPDAEIGTAKAASDAGILAVFSTLSTRSLEEIARAAPPGPRWFQLYLQPDFSVSRRLAERAAAAGYSALVLTVDMPIFPSRDRQVRSGFAVDSPPPMGNGADIVAPSRVLASRKQTFVLREDAAATWDMLGQLTETIDLPLVVKGILTADDARRAVQHGAKAVVVSNHGGRQLDGAPASLEVLTEIVEAVGRQAEVYFDGGVRRGSDVVTALALGARAVGLGRLGLWALAAGGQAGVSRMLALLEADVVTNMILLGRGRLVDLDREVLGPARW